MRDAMTDFLFQIALHRGRYSDPLALAPHYVQFYSQSGEDGMIAEIFRRIGTRDRFFVEIGSGIGLENSTRFLLEQGWSGVWVEASGERAARAMETFDGYIDAGRLKVVSEVATVEHVNEVLKGAGVPATYDLLSLDIDQNTSHVWRALSSHARVACIEYNASIPPSVRCEVPYDPNAQWDGTNWFGASLKTLEEIGTGKAMNLVGCDLLGVNAFFVSAAEAAGRFRAPFVAEEHYEPPRYRQLSRFGHTPSAMARKWLP